MNQPIWIIDAFTDVPFKGNPAAVCLLDEFATDQALQNIASEMNLAETAFLVRQSALHYHLRWFTPTTEVNLCGHATLAATHMLAESGLIASGAIVGYETLSGTLRASVTGNTVQLDFPALPGEPCLAHPALASAGIDSLVCEKNRDNYLVEVKDYKALLQCAPDFRALAAMDMQGVIVTTSHGVASGYDFASRYFAPGCGIDEDPVTGSAHCFLAPYWAKKLGKTHFHALQASKRQGILDVTLHHDRVLISGQAVTTLKGALQIPHRVKEKAA